MKFWSQTFRFTKIQQLLTLIEDSLILKLLTIFGGNYDKCHCN